MTGFLQKDILNMETVVCYLATVLEMMTMRPGLSLKTLFRAPFKTLVTFLLIAAASFAVFYRVADYTVTQREMTRAISYYRGVAALDNGVKNTALVLGSFLPNTVRSSDTQEEREYPAGLTGEQMRAFSSLPGVSATDTRYMTSGVIEGLKRIARYDQYIVRYDYTDRVVIEGTISGLETDDEWRGGATYDIHLTDCKLLAGGIPAEQADDLTAITFINESAFLTRGDMRVFFGLLNNPFDQDFIDGLSVGDRCLVIGRWDPRYFESDGRVIYTGDQDTLDYCDSFWLLNGKPENYLETEEFSKVREIVDITNRDLKTFDIVYTSDIYAIPRFNEGKMVIQEGRTLTKEDTNACVVNAALMELNGLKIGDKITVELCDKLILQHGEMGATAAIPERYGKPVKTVELEIVGSYLDIDAQYERDASEWWCYTPNTIFVPLSLLPVEPPEDYEIRPGEFSVVIDDAKEIETFLNAADPLAKEMGLKLRFSDRGWMKVKDSIDTSRTTALLTTALYLAGAAVALLLTAYLYIGRQKKAYAIMRALGTPRNKARNALALPLAVLSVVAIPIGGIGGMVYASRTLTSTLNDLAVVMEHYTPDASLPMGAMVLCLLGEVLILIGLSALFMRKLAKTPPLALLQGDQAQTGRRRIKRKAFQAAMDESAPIPQFTLSFPISRDQPKSVDYSPMRQVSHYILRHMGRAGWKTVIAVLLAFLLTGAMGLLAVTRLSYQEMFDKTEVKGTLTNYSSSAVMEASKSELMKNVYYNGGFWVILNDIPVGAGYYLAVTNDIDRYIQSISTYDYTIEYADGFDASLFSKNEPQCVMGKDLAEIYGVKPGDTVTLISWEGYETLSGMYETDDELIPQLKNFSQKFKLAGVVKTGDERISKVFIMAPLSKTAERASQYVEYPFPVEAAEFKLVDKEHPQQLISYIEELARDDKKYTNTLTYTMDTTELDNVRRMRDMLNTIFPIATAALIFIGLIAPVLIIMQLAKEAAILRILGTTKRRSRCILAIEQIGLCLLGLVIAAIGLVIYDAGLFVRGADTLALCGGLYLLCCALAASITAATVTRRKVLELLQVKE